MVLPLILGVQKAYQGLKLILYLVMLILAIVVLAGTAQSKSTSLGKFNLLLGVSLFIATMLYPYINLLQPLFSALGVADDKQYFVLFIFYALVSFLIIQVSNRNNDKVSGKEKTQNTNAKRGATGLLVLTIIILYFHRKGFDLAFTMF